VRSDRVPADKPVKGEETITVLPTATTSRKFSSW
jgi:hypothetical protein